MRTIDCLKGRVINFAVTLFAAVVKLFPELWFRFTKKSNPYARLFIPDLEKERNMFVTLCDSVISEHVWSRKLRLDMLGSSVAAQNMIFCEDIKTAAEFDALLASGNKDALKKACCSKQYTLNRGQVLQVCNCFNICMTALLENQPACFDVALIKGFNYDTLKCFVGIAPRKVVTTEMIEYLINMSEGFEREWRSFIALNLDKYPKSKSALLHLVQFKDLYQDWMRQSPAQDIFNYCFDNWNEKQQAMFIPALIEKALKERNSTVLSSIAWRCRDQFESIVEKMITAGIPCPTLLGFSDFERKQPELYAKAVQLSLKPGFADQILKKVVETFDKDTFRKYVLILARDGKLSYEQYSGLDDELREQVRKIQKDHADIAWLEENVKNLGVEMFVKGRQFSPYVQKWMFRHFFRALHSYSCGHELDAEVLHSLMDGVQYRDFLAGYCQRYKLSEELRVYLSFSVNKALLAEL